jgi:dUTP pyrophosphatase
MKVKFKRLDERATTPTKGSTSAAGYDLYAVAIDGYESFTIQAHTTSRINTGLAMEIPEGYFGAIYARSGLATKQGLRPANCVAVIDSDYRGEIIVVLHNDGDSPQTITKGERVAQLVIMPYLPVEFEEVDNLNDTDRGSGGFGRTGK